MCDFMFGNSFLTFVLFHRLQVSCDTSLWATIGGQDVERLPSASTCYNTLKVEFQYFQYFCCIIVKVPVSFLFSLSLSIASASNI